MKKLIVGVLMILAMAVTALAFVEPNVTYMSTMSTPYNDKACVYYNDLLYCSGKGYSYPYILADMYSIVPATGQITDLAANPLPTYYSTNAGCHLFGTMIYCFVGGINEEYPPVSFSYNIQTDEITELASIQEIGGASNSGSEFGCDQRPGSQDIWCYGYLNGSNKIFRYDTAEDNWDIRKEEGPVGEEYNYAPSCAWRNSEEFWCYGGYTGEDMGIDTIIKYTFSTMTYEVWHAQIAGAGARTRWANDVFYMYAMSDSDWMGRPEILYFDPATNETGALLTELPDDGYVNWYGCGDDGYTDMCLFNYDFEWSNQYDIFQIDWPCIPDWQCADYGKCTDGFEYCIETEDTRSCGETYTGDMSEFTQTCSLPGKGGKTRYILDDAGNVIGVVTGGVVQYFNQPTQGTFLSLTGGQQFDLGGWLKGLWASLLAIFGGK